MSASRRFLGKFGAEKKIRAEVQLQIRVLSEGENCYTKWANDSLLAEILPSCNLSVSVVGIVYYPGFFRKPHAFPGGTRNVFPVA